MFGSDMYVAAFIAVLVVMGLMKGADTCHFVTHIPVGCAHCTVQCHLGKAQLTFLPQWRTHYKLEPCILTSMHARVTYEQFLSCYQNSVQHHRSHDPCEAP